MRHHTMLSFSISRSYVMCAGLDTGSHSSGECRVAVLLDGKKIQLREDTIPALRMVLSYIGVRKTFVN